MKVGFLTRLKSTIGRAEKMRGIFGSTSAALLFILRVKRNKSLSAQGTFAGLSFGFRGTDLSAVEEVLSNQEYVAVTPFLEGSKAPIVIDAGANVGAFAIWAFSRAPSAVVTSVEADPSTFSVLEKNVSAAVKQGRRWACLNRAAWSDDSALRFDTSGNSPGHRVGQSGTVLVQGITLEAILATISGETVDVFKIDIEGAEDRFLGQSPDLFKSVRCLIVELHPDLCDTEQVLRTLKGAYGNCVLVSGRSSAKPLYMFTRS